ncbi:tyrosinase [Hamiltosporidium magnivora]|uniref:Tyrosinase n=2 Tax=Hamiltosporidium magnivora TaxID=148818 RepID=A0A4Q9LG08_9MICR|nr:tyrosinase [Hamiltosporidium magnivora]
MYDMCKKYVIRKEIRDMTEKEWMKYKDALLKVYNEGLIEEITKIHVFVDDYAHNNDRFLPWHRMFLLYFESILQFISNDDSLCVPYWDWTLDAENPSDSIIFSEKYLGFNECLKLYFPSEHCLKRKEGIINPFYNKSKINKLLKIKKDYNEFREALEIVPHALVHAFVGGDDGDMSMMYSTNDPIFWHHHSFIDYIWHKKQKNDKNYNYNGKDNKGNKVSKEDILFPFNKRVKDILKLEDCCVKYKEYNHVKIQTYDDLNIYRLPESYIKRHKYSLNKVRKIENSLQEIKRQSRLKKIFIFLKKLFID